MSNQNTNALVVVLAIVLGILAILSVIVLLILFLKSPTPVPPTIAPTATFTPSPVKGEEVPVAEKPSPAVTAPPPALPTPPPTAIPTATFTPSPPAESPAVTVAEEPSPTAPAPPPAPAPIPPAPPASPSGRIAFPVFDPNRQTFDLYVAQADGSGRQRLLTDASQPAFNRNGRRLAYRSWVEGQLGIWVREMDSGQAMRLTTPYEDFRPRWSADGRILVYFSRVQTDRLPRIYQVGSGGGVTPTEVRCQVETVLGAGPAWLPDGRIVYQQYELNGNSVGLYLMNADGCGQTRLTPEGTDRTPAPSPTGNLVAFMSQARDTNWEVYVVDINGTGLRNLSRREAKDGLPTWSPDGQWIAFVSDHGGAWAVWAVRPDGTGLRKLFDTGGPLDGQVRTDFTSARRGWTDEQIAWGPLIK